MEQIKKPIIRIKAMDYVRALAIIFMIFTHWLNILMGEQNYESYPAVIFEDTIGTWAHAMFLLIVGMSLFFSVYNRKSKGENSTKHILIRGLFLIGLGFFLNLLWNLQSLALIDIFLMDILVIIGLSIIIVYFIFLKLPLKGKIVVLVIAIILTPILQHFFLYNGPYQYEDYPEDGVALIVHYLTNGYFPIFPCITYVMLGFILAEIFLGIKEEQNKQKEDQYIIGLFLVSIPLIIIGYLFEFNDFLWELIQWEHIYLLTLYGMSLLFLSIFMVVERVTPESEDSFKPLSEIGVMSLSIYLFDQIIGITFENFILYPYLPMALSIIIVLIGIVLVFVFTHLWLKKFKYGPIEWILRKLDK